VPGSETQLRWEVVGSRREVRPEDGVVSNETCGIGVVISTGKTTPTPGSGLVNRFHRHLSVPEDMKTIKNVHQFVHEPYGKAVI
jgi:hypothetical protein